MAEPHATMWKGWMVMAAVILGVGTLTLALARQPATRAASQGGRPRPVATASARIPVTGMTCPVCVASVKEALLAVSGVETADVSLERREVVVRYDERQVLLSQLVAAINRTGYRAGTPIVPREER